MPDPTEMSPPRPFTADDLEKLVAHKNRVILDQAARIENLEIAVRAAQIIIANCLTARVVAESDGENELWRSISSTEQWLAEELRKR